MPGKRLLLMVHLIRFIKAGGRHDTAFAPKRVTVRRQLGRRLGLGVDRAEFALLILRPSPNAGSTPKTSGKSDWGCDE